MVLTEELSLTEDTLHYFRSIAVEECPAAMHQQFEMLYVRHGRLHGSIDGMDTVLSPGDLALMAPFVRHQWDVSRNATVDILVFSPQLCPEAARIFATKRPKRPILYRNEIPTLALHLMRAIAELLPAGQKDSMVSLPRPHPAELYLSVLVLELVKATGLEDTPGASLSATQRILNFCANSFTQDISRETVAAACEVSPSTVSQTFARLGTTFREYINDLRITRAHHLLHTTERPITEIIYECGYSNQGTFNRNFAAKYGHPPRELRSLKKK